MPRKSTTREISKDALVQYMATELDILNKSAIHNNEMMMNKINFFLVLVTAIVSGLVLVAGISNMRDLALPIACVVILVLIAMGINTLQQSLDLSASSTTYYRRAGRIRKWLVEQEPSIESYLPFTVADNLPRLNPGYANLRGTESILLIMNASLIGTLLGLLIIFGDFYIIRQMQDNMQAIEFAIAIVLGLVGMGVAWISQVRYVKRFMQKWEKRQQDLELIHFPVEYTEEFNKLLS